MVTVSTREAEKSVPKHAQLLTLGATDAIEQLAKYVRAWYRWQIEIKSGVPDYHYVKA